jgi:hypothetical protein
MLISAKDVSTAFDVAAYQVKRWVDRGMPMREDGKFELKDVVKWHQDNWASDLAEEKGRASKAKAESTSLKSAANRSRKEADKAKKEVARLKLNQETAAARFTREKNDAVRAVKGKGREAEQRIEDRVKKLQDANDSLKDSLREAKTGADQSTADLERMKLELECQLRAESLAKKQMERRVWERNYSRVDEISLSVSTWCQRIRLTLMQMGDTIPTLVPGKDKSRVKRDVQRRIQTTLSEMYQTKIGDLVVKEMVVMAAHLIMEEGDIDKEALIALMSDSDTSLTVGSDRFLPAAGQYSQHGKRTGVKKNANTPRKKRVKKKAKGSK